MASNLAGMAFLPYYRQIMQILETNKELRKSAKGIFTQMAYAAAGTAVGGFIGGPPGALVGGVAGSIMGYMTVEPYEAMLTVLRDMSDEDKENLVNKVKELVGSSGLEALTTFLGQQVNREIFLQLVRGFAAEVSKGG